MTLVTTPAHRIQPGDLYIFDRGNAVTVKAVYRTQDQRVRVTFTDPTIRYGACAPDSVHTIGRW